LGLGKTKNESNVQFRKVKGVFMRIEFVEIQNFRKLRSCHIDLAEKTTVFVGANNSGKTSAMDALSLFLLEKNQFTTTDFTLSNWIEINNIGDQWVNNVKDDKSLDLSITLWQNYLPSLDVWLKVENDEIHYVSQILPTLDWNGDSLGIRLRFEPKNIEDLYKDYFSSFQSAKETTDIAKKQEGTNNVTLQLWPRTMREFLDKRLNTHFTVRAFTLDPTKRKPPEEGVAQPQELPVDSLFLDEDPFKGLIKIDKINAQRGFSDPNKNSSSLGSDGQNQQEHGNLSAQLRNYYAKHINPSELPDISDIEALQAIEDAQSSFDGKLRKGFKSALSELESLGYPGFTDPKITVLCKIRPMDSLNHSSAVQFEVISNEKDKQKIPLRLPEQYNGLGYQNLISMVFKLMGFRDEWMRVGKAGKKVSDKSENFIHPLHFVLVEEPEAHLHAQVQQVFIRKAYEVLRKHDNLGDNKHFTTQLVVSTHSSHIAHEIDFASLRYFRRKPVQNLGDVPTSTVVNLSKVFGTGDETDRFATRYLKTTHCDLFFADAAILVEGPAERMLVPHFIRHHFEKLNGSYLSLLEIGGSHAHRLRPLIEHLGLITLIITDLDSADPKNRNSAVQPNRSCGFKTGNSTLKTWIPEKENIDELLDSDFSVKVKKIDEFSSIRVAYQCPVEVEVKGNKKEEVIPYTFEDTLVFENLELFKGLEGNGLVQKFNEAIKENETAKDLGLAMFNALRNGEKAAFALELFYFEDPAKVKVPTYIHEGLSWLQDQLERKQKDVLLSITGTQGGKSDGK
jgi:predicted ATP-dependent endonuclease of OLD family